MSDEFVTVRGVEKLSRFLRQVPDAAADNLQRIHRSNHIDHVKEIRRTSGFGAKANARVARTMEVSPEAGKVARRIKDVEGDTRSYWMGDTQDPDEGVAARIEKRVGVKSISARGKMLAIPMGPLLTKGTDRPKFKRTDAPGASRASGRHVQVSDYGKKATEQTFTTPTGDGRAYVWLRKVRKKKAAATGARTRRRRRRSNAKPKKWTLIGILQPRARVKNELNFFGAWDNLRSKRRDRYQSLLNDIANGKLRPRGGSGGRR